MAKVAPGIVSFNSGELSPLVVARRDIKYYPNGCRRVRNFQLTPQGPARRRPPTRFVAEVKNSANRTWLGRFEFNVTQAYVTEWGDLYVRFFANHGVVGAPFELATPYVIADLISADGSFALQSVQSNDVRYMVHRLYQPRKLTRTAAAVFTIPVMDPQGGPFKDMNPDETTTVYIDNGAVGAGRNLTASTAIFLAGHVGAIFYLEQRDGTTTPQWEPGKVVAAAAVCTSDGKNYTTAAGGTTGTVRPTHSRGSQTDGTTGVLWTYTDAKWGWGKITAIGGGGTTAVITIFDTVPAQAVGAGNASTRWAHGAWSDVEGWPTTVTFFKERLIFARDRRIWGSVVGDYENFRKKDDGGLVTRDMSFSIDITSDRANNIVWLAPSDYVLMVGSAGDEHVVSAITSTEAFGPGNIQSRKQSEYGSRAVPIARVGDGVLFAQKSGRKLRDMGQAESINEKWVSKNTTVLAEHVTRGGLVDMAYQQEPDSVAWFTRTDGTLIGFTIDREQDVRGFHPHRIGGYYDAAKSMYARVESVVSIPAPDAGRDEVWMIVNRNINGATKRYIEWGLPIHEEGDDPEDAFHLDASLTLDNVMNVTLTPGAGATVKGTAGVVFVAGAPIFAAGDVGKSIHYRYSVVDIKGYTIWKKGVAEITAFTDTTHVTCTVWSVWPNLSVIPANGWRKTFSSVAGLGHLEGETVHVWADGGNHPGRVVVAGAITLDGQYGKVHIGEPCPAVLMPMPIEDGAEDGSSQGKTKRAHRVALRFHDTLGARYGRDEDKQLDQVLQRGGSDNMDEPPPLFTGLKIVAWPDGYTDDETVMVYCDTPGPCSVTAMIPQMVTQSAR